MYFVLISAIEEARAQLSIADGQGIFHPVVRRSAERSGLCVPKREFRQSAYRCGRDALHLVVSVGHVLRQDKFHGVVHIVSRPQTNLISQLRTAPLVESVVATDTIGVDFPVGAKCSHTCCYKREAVGVGRGARFDACGIARSVHIGVESGLVDELEIALSAHELPFLRWYGVGSCYLHALACTLVGQIATALAELHEIEGRGCFGAKHRQFGLSSHKTNGIVVVAGGPLSEVHASRRAAPLVHAL